MEKLVKSSKIGLNIVAPSSKSEAQRVIIASFLAKGTSVIEGITSCDDVDSAVDVIRKLGAKVDIEGNTYTITSDFDKNLLPDSQLMCGESGLLSRTFASIMSLCKNEMTINGNKSLLTRPFSSLKCAIEKLGGAIEVNNDHLPIVTKGGIKGGEIDIDCNITSQFISGLLMALPLADNDSVITVSNLKSKPYLNLTVDVLFAFGIEVENSNYQTFKIKGGQKYIPTNYNVGGDWSSAAIFLVAGAVAGKVSVSNLDINSTQADREILELFKRCDVDFDIKGNTVTTRKSNILAFGFDADNCPDLIPAIVALASQASDTCCIKGVNRLKYKESNRTALLKSEFEKLGVVIDIDEDDDLMYVTPHKGLKGGVVDTHGDHRMVMAFAIAGLCSEEGVAIQGAQCVNKSYPKFWGDLESSSI